MEAKCKGGVGANSISSLTIVVGDRRGSLGVGFQIENMRLSWLME